VSNAGIAPAPDRDRDHRDDTASPSLVLASASRTRQRVLAEAGVVFVVDPADVDETARRAAARARRLSAEDAATALAEEKALAVARRWPQALVIGADQILECGSVWFEKPRDLEAARAALLALRGRRHRLVSAVAVASAERCLWRHVGVAVMTMRPFSNAFLDRYLDTAGLEALDTVAGYRYEGPGIQLFSAVEGEVFTILGLPLLPLLAVLRAQRVLTD
jgi:septum formation protein